jgi:hypothetical protein
MRIDFQEKYPLIFRNKDPMEPINMFGNECPKGWDELLDTTFRLIYNKYKYRKDDLKFWSTKTPCDHFTEEKIKDSLVRAEVEFKKAEENLPIVAQCKSKFGSLRLYCDNVNEYSQGVIDMAESISCFTCEFCGSKGKPSGGRWITTLCPSCEENSKKKLASDIGVV